MTKRASGGDAVEQPRHAAWHGISMLGDAAVRQV
jgi:hypothetical protein